ncbi:heat shock protein 70 family [Phaeosphaeriaceae sp. PMI808]|nr:heat shock protein 70 family [Phaeosphaeriaceae sp. PMI808]
MGDTKYSIGIDLGTANTCTALFRNDNVEIVTHEGQSLMPSYVTFTETCRLVGSAAKSQAVLNPRNTIFGALKFIGKDFHDPEIQSIISNVPFRVTDLYGKPVFLVEYQGEEITMTPIELIAMILARARDDADNYLANKYLTNTYLAQGYSISGAVITVPTHFNLCQRRAILDAAKIAELDVYRLISATSTIASDYIFTRRTFDNDFILFLDFGAGSLDVALAMIEEGIIEIKAVAWETSLGGDIIDMRLVQEAVENLERKQGVLVNSRTYARLRVALETSKCALSFDRHRIEIDDFSGGGDFECNLSRKTVEDKINFQAMLRPIKEVLNSAKVDASEVHTIVLSGGFSRVPKIQSTLGTLFEKEKISKSVHPDESAAKGAAIHAAILSGTCSMLISEILLIDVLSHTIGVAANGSIVPLLKKNTITNCGKAIEFAAHANHTHQKYPIMRLSMHVDNNNPPETTYYYVVDIYEGEGRIVTTAGPTLIGRFELAPRSNLTSWFPIEIKACMDANYHLGVTAREIATGYSTHLLNMREDRMSEDLIRELKEKAGVFAEAQRAEENRMEAKGIMETYLVSLLEDSNCWPNSEGINQHIQHLKNSLTWLDENPMAAISDYQERYSQLKKSSENIVNCGHSGNHLRTDEGNRCGC